MVQGAYILLLFSLYFPLFPNTSNTVSKYKQIWELFLAWSVIASRQGSATCYQMVVVKNLNSTHRITGVSNQYGLMGALAKSREAGKSRLP